MQYYGNTYANSFIISYHIIHVIIYAFVISYFILMHIGSSEGITLLEFNEEEEEDQMGDTLSYSSRRRGANSRGPP